MAQVRQHVNARLTARQRRAMVEVMLDGWSVTAAAQRFQVDPKTARKWRDRFGAEGSEGLFDRSSRPHRSPGRTPEATRAEVIGLRRCQRRGAGYIAHVVGLAPYTAQAILADAGLGASIAVTGPPSLHRCATCAKGPVNSSMSTSRSCPPSPQAAAGASTGAATPPPTAPSATATCTPPSTTAPASPTARTSTTNAAPPPRRSGAAPTPSSPPVALPASKSSPTTAPATDPPTGARRARRPPQRPSAPAPTGPKPTAKSNASTASSSRNGPTSAPGPAKPNATGPTADSSTTTITTDPTARSAGTHEPPPSGTTSPACTPSGHARKSCWCCGWLGRPI